MKNSLRKPSFLRFSENHNYNTCFLVLPTEDIDLERLAYSSSGGDYTGRAARTEVEAFQFIGAGFDYARSIGEAKLFRKRK